MSCIIEKCYDCLNDKDECFCKICSCGTQHVCVNCISRYTDDGTYKLIKCWCTTCKTVRCCWYNPK